MPKDRRKKTSMLEESVRSRARGQGRVDTDTGEEILSAAERLAINPDASLRQRAGAVRTILRSNTIRRQKHSPGYTLDVPAHPEQGDADLGPRNPADKFDPRMDPSKPTVR